MKNISRLRMNHATIMMLIIIRYSIFYTFVCGKGRFGHLSQLPIEIFNGVSRMIMSRIMRRKGMKLALIERSQPYEHDGRVAIMEGYTTWYSGRFPCRVSQSHYWCGCETDVLKENHSKLVFFNTILHLAVSFSFIVHLSLGTLNVTISGGCNDVTTIVAAAIIALCCS